MFRQKPVRVLMIVENCPFSRDPRVRKEAFTLQSAGYHVAVICPKATASQPWRECIDGIIVYRYRPTPAGLRASGYFFEYAYATLAIALLSLIVLMRERFDVIHVANPPDTMVVTSSLYKIIGKRIIYDQHDLCPELLQSKFARLRWMMPLVLWLEKWSYRLADHVIVTNESYRTTALLRGKIPPSKVTVVRNGPEVRNVFHATIDWQVRDKSKNIIVYTGTIGAQDGLDCLCRILRCLRYDLDRQDFYCVVLGDGDALREVKALARELKLENNIWFTGWIDDSSKYLTYLNTADICVSTDPLTSYNNQSTFIKIMDYMAAGKPIVSFDLAETRFSAQDAALYSRAHDEKQFAGLLAELMDKPALREELGRRGEGRLRDELAWQYSEPALLTAYEACLSGAGSMSEQQGLNMRGKSTQDKQAPGEMVGAGSIPARSRDSIR